MPENLVSRDGFSRPVPRQSAHLHTQAESGAYLLDSSRVPLYVYVSLFEIMICLLSEMFVVDFQQRRCTTSQTINLNCFITLP